MTLDPPAFFVPWCLCVFVFPAQFEPLNIDYGERVGVGFAQRSTKTRWWDLYPFGRRVAMTRLGTFATSILVITACLTLMPGVASAQSGFAGIVKDTSGAILPGVAVEASSPALIEGRRSAVTD